MFPLIRVPADIQVFPVFTSWTLVVPTFLIKPMSFLTAITLVESFITKREVLLPTNISPSDHFSECQIDSANLSGHGSLYCWWCLCSSHV